MNFKNILKLVVIAAGFAPMYAQAVSLNITCEGSVPNGRSANTRNMSLEIESSLSGVANGYKENRFYGGAYAEYDDGIGSIENVTEAGSKVSFTLVRRAELSVFGLPIWLDPADQEVMPAQYDIVKKELVLDTSKVPYMHRSPSVLTCTSKF